MHELPSIFERFDPPFNPPPALAVEPRELLCSCSRPIPQERAQRKWAARTFCARCDRPLPLRLRPRAC